MTIGHTTLPRAGAVPRDGDAEPDRVRGHVSAAGGADRPLHAQDPDRLPGARRGADDRAAPARRRRRSCARRCRSTTCAALQRAVVRHLRRPGARQLRGRRSPTRRATRGSTASTTWREYISFGASPRGPISLVQAARALALLRGRDYVARRGPAGAGEGRAPPPARAHVPGARGGGDARTRSSTACSRRCPVPQIDLARTERGVSPVRALRADATPDRPGPGPMPERLLRALDVSIGRRIDGPARGRLPLVAARGGHRARAGAAVRARRRRAPDRLERDRAHRRAARPRPARRARARHLARARHVAVDAVRHGRPAQGRRRGGSRDRDRARRDAPRQPARARHVRRRARRARCRRGRDASA